MSAERFSTGKQFFWQGDTYEVRRLLPGSNLSVVNVRTGAVQTISFSVLLKALFDSELSFGGSGRLAEGAVKSGYVDLSDCPEELRVIAEYRLEVILPLLKLPPGERKKAIEARVEEFKKKRQDNERSMQTAISVSSVYRWIADYMGSGEDIRALIPATEKRGGKHKSRLKPEVEAIIKAAIEDLYYVREKRTVDYIHREVAVRIDEENLHRPAGDRLKSPSRSTIARRIAAVDMEGKLVAKRGKRAAKRELAEYGVTEYPTIPLERVEIDHTRTDVVVIDDEDLLPLGRLTLTHCLDTATRYPLGYYLGFEPPSY